MREDELAFHNTEAVFEVDRALVEDVKRRARGSARGCFRVCLHGSVDEPVQEMVLAAQPRFYARPHRHPERSTTFLVLEGALDVFVFDDRGRVTRRLALTAPSRSGSFCVRLAPSAWHTTLAKSDPVVFFETMRGPYGKDVSNVYASWSPDEDDTAGIEKFLAELEQL